MKIILKTLCIDIFEPQPAPPSSTGNGSSQREQSESPRFYMQPKRSQEYYAEAWYQEGDFVVAKDSIVQRSETQGVPDRIANLRKTLLHNGVLQHNPSGDRLQFTQNYPLGSPSTAASIVAGRSASGSVEWKIKGTDMSLGEWRQQQVGQ